MRWMLCLLALAGCAAPVEKPVAKPVDPEVERHRIVAERRAQGVLLLVHRGAWGMAPENTLQAYARAMDRGADGVEIDIRKSKDGVLYLFHDPTVDRMLDGSGPVKDLTYAQLASMRFRDNMGIPDEELFVPTLDQFLELARQRAMLLHLDIKDEGIDEDVARALSRARVWEHVVKVNDYNSDKIRKHPDLKRQRGYKGWVKPDASDYLKTMEKPGNMIFIDKDPLKVARIMDRPIGDPVPVPKELLPKR